VRFDDAFIGYRYGQNLAEGNGLVFNPGERVWGSTSVAWVFVSAAVHRLVGHDVTPSAMAAIGCLAWTAACVLVYELLRPSVGAKGAVAASVALALGTAGSFCWVGMETNLAFALGLGALLAAFRGRWNAATALAAFAILTRPDAIVPAALVAVLALVKLRAGALARAAAGLALLAPWYVYQWVHFGSLVASSMTAKIGMTPLQEYAVHIVTLVPAELFAMVTGWSAPGIAIYAAPIVWPLVGYGAVAAVSKDKRLVVLPAWLLLHAAGYLAWRPLANQTWHLYPLVALSAVLFWLGLADIYDRIAPANLVRRLAFSLVVATLGLLTLLRTGSFALEGQHRIFWFGGRHAAYVDAARLMRTSSLEGEAAAGGEVGTLAYYSGIPVHDWNGLVTPNAWRMVQDLANGNPGAIRWLVAWAGDDVAYFAKTVDGHPPHVFEVSEERSIYFFDLHSASPPP
jgi:hypothetical protein